MEEILAGNGINNAFKELNIASKQTYQMRTDPYFEVWELNNKDLRVMQDAIEWPEEFGWYRHARGSNMGIPFDFFTVKGEFMIGWSTEDGRDTYDSLMDYFYNGLSVGAPEDVCMLATDLAKANGKTMATLFKTYEG